MLQCDAKVGSCKDEEGCKGGAAVSINNVKKGVQCDVELGYVGCGCVCDFEARCKDGLACEVRAGCEGGRGPC